MATGRGANCHADDNANTQAPPDDPGWLNVGDRGVYLGDRWVLTAAHVGIGSITFPGVGTFNHVPGSGVRVPNPPGVTSTADADLLLFRIHFDSAPPPELVPLTIASQTPEIGETVTLIGYGGQSRQALQKRIGK